MAEPDTANDLPIIIHHQGVHKHTFCDQVNFLAAAEFGSGVELLIVFETMRCYISDLFYLQILNSTSESKLKTNNF